METQTIFFEGKGNIPANLLAKLIYENEDKLVKTTADTEWDDGSPAQIRFEFNMSRDEADDVVTDLNSELEDSGVDLNANGSFYLMDEQQRFPKEMKVILK